MSNHLLWVCSPVCVVPGQKPECWLSHVVAQIIKTIGKFQMLKISFYIIKRVLTRLPLKTKHFLFSIYFQQTSNLNTLQIKKMTVTKRVILFHTFTNTTTKSKRHLKINVLVIK